MSHKEQAVDSGTGIRKDRSLDADIILPGPQSIRNTDTHTNTHSSFCDQSLSFLPSLSLACLHLGPFSLSLAHIPVIMKLNKRVGRFLTFSGLCSYDYTSIIFSTSSLSHTHAHTYTDTHTHARTHARTSTHTHTHTHTS